MEYRLPEELLIYYVTEQKVALLALLRDIESDRPVGTRAYCYLIAKDVMEMDAAGLQLLVAFKHECASRDINLLILEPSRSFKSVCGLFGLQSFLLPNTDESPATSVHEAFLKESA